MGPLFGFLLLCFFLLAVFIRDIFKRFEAPGPCLHGREYGEIREVFPSGYNWEVVRNDETGDVDVLPLREDHGRGASCLCHPRVDIEGACLVVVHNSYDNREIVEDAIRIMNGVESDIN